MPAFTNWTCERCGHKIPAGVPTRCSGCGRIVCEQCTPVVSLRRILRDRRCIDCARHPAMPAIPKRGGDI